MCIRDRVLQLKNDWEMNERWAYVERPYTAEEVVKLRGSLQPEYTLARIGAEKLWNMLHKEDYVNCLGTLTGGQAVQGVKAGAKAIYVSGWQVAADNNSAEAMYPDQSLYPVDSVPSLVKRINSSFKRAHQIEWMTSNGNPKFDFFTPIVADAEAGFGGVLNAFELMKAMIKAGAAGVHFEDQLASVKKCGHMGGKVVIPTSQFVRTLSAARLAADVLGVSTILCARTDSLTATLMTNDIDPADHQFMTGERTEEGYFGVTGGLESSIARSKAYAPYADLLWFETQVPDMDEARQFAEAIHAEFPDRMLAYNCYPYFNWRANLDDASIATFQQELGKMGYKFQFITLAGWHMVNLNAFELAKAYKAEGMTAYVRLQEREFELESTGYTAVKHQQEVGAGYFDQVLMTVTEEGSTGALVGSTESGQF
mgnify:CR=1 FL=1